MSEAFDVVVIGGGIVGMATAMALTGRRHGSIAVLEAEPQLAAHQTGRNSGVIHSGIYYKPGSLKARLCVDGRSKMLQFCAERGIETSICGKVIVATNEAETAALEILEQRAALNGVRARRCSLEELREREPHVAGAASLLVESAGIVDYAEVTRQMARVVEERGGAVRMDARVVGAKTDDGGRFILETARGVVTARNVVNCAGLHCDEIARLCGLDPDLAIIPFRGEYYDLVPSRRGLCKHLVYPVPDARYPFLGVHFTRGVSGAVEAGPNAVLALKREGYTKTSFSFRDTSRLLGYAGFWRMARRHWKTGVAEMYRSLSKAAFVRSLQRLIPEVTADDLEPGRAGVRAQAVDADGKLADDFRLLEGEGMLHVLNAPSPAATASIAIGEALATSAARVFRAPARTVARA